MKLITRWHGGFSEQEILEIASGLRENFQGKVMQLRFWDNDPQDPIELVAKVEVVRILTQLPPAGSINFALKILATSQEKYQGWMYEAGTLLNYQAKPYHHGRTSHCTGGIMRLLMTENTVTVMADDGYSQGKGLPVIQFHWGWSLTPIIK